MSRRFIVRGTNPTTPEITAELGGQWYWPNILYAEHGAIGARQFDSGGHPLLGPPHGFGIGQVELSPTPGTGPGYESADRQLAKMFNWKLNVSAMKQLNASNSTSAQDRFWDDWLDWLGYTQANGGPTDPLGYSEVAGSSQPSCTFVAPYNLVYTFEGRSYIDAMTIKMYNGADRPYIRWNNDVGGIGWAVAPTQLKRLSPWTCLRYVRRGCTHDFSNLPTVNNGCDVYHFNWVSTF